MSLLEPFGIVFGGFKVNAMENTSSINVGETFLQALDSIVKNNLIAGQTYGDFDLINEQSIASPIYDSDLQDTVKPMIMSPLGLED
ncbi:MAG: hypothetical protein ACOYWZ_05795 [Bacillota bacterium]